MNKISSSGSTKRTHDFNLEHFRIRLTARLGIIIVCLILYIPRLASLFGDPTMSVDERLFVFLDLPFPIIMIIIILFEYFLFKRLGPRIVKYSNLVDILLLLVFTTDWIIILIANLNRIQQTTPVVCFKLTALFMFTAFSWRTLMVTLIVQNWLLKLIPPVSALAVATGFAIYHSPGTMKLSLYFSITQLMNLIIIMYCEDRMKWKIAWASIQKDKWMQVNNFILNSLPENIMILDLTGEAKFISEYCKSFLEKCQLPLDTKEFFKKVQDLHRQQCDCDLSNPSTNHPERLATEIQFLPDNEKIHTSEHQLEDLVENFKDAMINRQIQEKQFLVYNGKLKIEGQQDKSLEVKISFVQHFENSYIILIIRDTTQRDLLVTLEETNKYKDHLLASVSHELRAPLNGTINMVEGAVQSKKIPENIKEALLIPALRSSKFLLHLINDILDMSQIKEKKLRLLFQSESLKETLKSTSQLVELQAKKKGIELLLDIDSNLPNTFCTDHIRLSQIVLNLLNNAIKFTKEGTVKLKATALSQSNLVQISVEDSGIGMNQENLDKLFSSYTHIEFEGRQNVNPTGVGLGLNISYNLAVLLGPKDHQGISVTSVPGKGSTFTLLLEQKQMCSIELPSLDKSIELCGDVAEELGGPLGLVSFPRMHRISSGSSGSIASIIEKCESTILLNDKSSCTCAKILIVDDNPFNTMACETICGSLEIKCDSVYSGSACLKSLLNRQTTKPCGEKCKQYDVVLMDQEMPEMSGSETVKEILKLQSQNLLSTEIKIVGCTAHKSKEEVDKFMETGIEKCIHKPISVVVIKDILKGTN